MKRLASQRLRDRDAIVADNQMIFRVYGYSHPPGAYICDPEYAPADVYRSRDPRAYREKDKLIYYKFYTDEGLRLVQQRYPQYTVWHEPLQRSLVGVRKEQITETRQPDAALQTLLGRQPGDKLLLALHALLNLLQQRSSLKTTDFGVFGSLLHSFYHPEFSDLDLTIYGKQELRRLIKTIDTLYEEQGSLLRNEFDNMKSVEGKHWRFQNYSLKEYVWHQKRKRVYGLFHHKESGRTIKTEFEPVKRWQEIENEYNPYSRVKRKGWIKMLARITNDNDSPFMPSIYQVEPVKILKGEHVDNLERIVSFVEEFRMQARTDELVVVEGNLEKVNTGKETLHQVTLTHGPRYYEQTLKVIQPSLDENHGV